MVTENMWKHLHDQIINGQVSRKHVHFSCLAHSNRNRACWFQAQHVSRVFASNGSLPQNGVPVKNRSIDHHRPPHRRNFVSLNPSVLELAVLAICQPHSSNSGWTQLGVRKGAGSLGDLVAKRSGWSSPRADDLERENGGSTRGNAGYMCFESCRAFCRPLALLRRSSMLFGSSLICVLAS